MTLISDEAMSDDQLHKNDHALSLAFTFVLFILTCCLLCLSILILSSFPYSFYKLRAVFELMLTTKN